MEGSPCGQEIFHAVAVPLTVPLSMYRHSLGNTYPCGWRGVAALAVSAGVGVAVAGATVGDTAGDVATLPPHDARARAGRIRARSSTCMPIPCSAPSREIMPISLPESCAYRTRAVLAMSSSPVLLFVQVRVVTNDQSPARGNRQRRNHRGWSRVPGVVEFQS